jgi:outer membrane protein
MELRRISFALLALTFSGSFSARSVNAAENLPRLRLSELFEKTVSTSERVRTKEEERAQIIETKNQTYGNLFPQIYGVGTYYRADLPTTPGGTTSSFSSSSATQKVLKLTAKEYIFKGGAEYAFIAKTNRLIDARESEIEANRQGYFLDLATAYYDTLLRRSEVAHSKTELGLYDDQIAELKNRVKIGRTRASELLSVQAARAGSEARFRSAEAALTSSKIRLANLARISPEFELIEETPAKTPIDSLETYLKLSGQRPDLQAARKKRDAAVEDVSIQRDGHFPTLDVSGNYYLKREGFGNNDSKWDAILTLSVPIYSGGTTSSTVRQYASILKATEIETGRLERAAENDIRSLHQNLVASENQLKSSNEAVELATKSYDQTRKDYKFGLTTNLDLLNSLKTLTEAKRNLDQARYQHFLERIQIEVGSGRIPKLEN